MGSQHTNKVHITRGLRSPCVHIDLEFANVHMYNHEVQFEESGREALWTQPRQGGP